MPSKPDASAQMAERKLAVEDWGAFCGWVIVDNDADLDDGEGGYDPMARLCVAGFNSRAGAARWLRVSAIAMACGVRYGFRRGLGYD